MSHKIVEGRRFFMIKVIKKIYDAIISLLVAAVVILVMLLVGVRLFGIKPFTVLSGSMEPRYHVGSVIYVEEVDDVTFEVPSQTEIIVKGINKQNVGQIAAQIREKRPPEPYHGKGVRYADERVRHKAGKAGK